MLTNQRSILHVDDDPLACRCVAELLGDRGYEVESVIDPMKAMEALIQGQYQVVLSDIHMPGKSGIHLLSEIKAHDPGVQVIMLTGRICTTTLLETHQLGAEACLVKPTNNPSILFEAVDDAFRRVDRWWRALRDLKQLQMSEDSTSVALAGAATLSVL